VWGEPFGGSALAGSDSDSCDEAAVDDEEYDGGFNDDLIAARSSVHTRPRTNIRSQSSASSSSASTSTSTSTDTSPSYQIPNRRNYSPSSASQRRFSTSTARPHIRLPPSCPPTPRRRRRAPPLIRTTTATSNSDPRASPPLAQPTHVTIAPIAPTILKTGGYANGSEWVEGLGDEGGSDDGMIGGRWWGAGAGEKRQRDSIRDSERESGEEDGGTPVELVYVPPHGSNYSVRGRERPLARQRARRDPVEIMEDHEDGLGHGERDVYQRRHRLFSVGVVGDDEADVDVDGGVDVAQGTRTPSPRTSPLPVPMVVVDPDTNDTDTRNDNVRGKDAYDYFGGPDLGEDFPVRGRNLPARGRRGSEGGRGRPTFSSSSSLGADVERSRSRSKSRTPSPAIISSSDAVVSATAETTPASDSPESVPIPVPSAPVPVRRSASASPPYTQTLLSPPPRGRGSSSQQDLQVHTRGRSSTRTVCSILDREGRDRSSIGSPLGSYSPDGVGLVSVGGAYAGGRIDRERDKRFVGDRDRGRDREQPRGRDRTGKRLSHSLSPDDFPAATTPTAPVAPVILAPTVALAARDMSQVNVVSPPDAASSITPPAAEHRQTEEAQHYLIPTPSNSPVVSMQSVPSALAPNVTVINKPSSPKGRSAPLAVPAPHPAEPSTSYSISPPREQYVRSSPKNSRSPTSPTRGDGTIVGKAVGMVSSAGAFLGLWQHSGTESGGA
jgi:hypothetical protein